MSALEFLLENKDQVAPYFQPIISLQNQRIIGYETLGRKVEGGKVLSLGSFFNNSNVPSEDHKMIDRLLREKAFQYLSDSDQKPLLFINIKPSWITGEYREDQLPLTLRLLEKYGISPSQIVIEITEEAIKEKTEQFLQVIEKYKEKGCSIAIDDVGSGFSNFDRIALVRPQIIKVDLKIIKHSRENDGYLALLRSFSILATQVGASLLVEGVETAEDLQNSLSIGARYIQGFFFSEAKEHFLDENSFTNVIRKEMNTYTDKQFFHFNQFFFVEERLHKIFNKLSIHIKNAENADWLLEQLTEVVPLNCMRMYICRGDGTQVSSNFAREGLLHWEKDETMQEANWCWRPHFIPNILRMKNRKQGIVSHIYTDLESNKTIQTFSYSVDSNHFLFLDITI